MEEPIRVLHIFGALHAGGAESRTMDIYRNINRDKVQFDFLVHTNERGHFEEEIEYLGGRIYRVSSFKFKNYYEYRNQIKRLLNSTNHNIIHGHMLSTAFIYMKVAKDLGIPVRIAHSRSGIRYQKTITARIKNLTESQSGKYATHNLAVSKLAGEHAFRKDPKNYKIIPNAINVGHFKFDSNIRNELRKKLQIENDYVLGNIGRFSDQKNHLFLIDTFVEFLKINSNAKLLLVGKGENEELVRNKIEKLGIKNKVLLLGVRNDVHDILKAIDVLVFPSTHEGLPGVVLEAQASGLPCVISDSITDEVQLTDLVNMVSLNKGYSYWAQVVSNTLEEKNVSREEVNDQLIEKGYDINSVAKWYEGFYLQQYKMINR